MRKSVKILPYVSLFVFILVSFLPAIFFIFTDYKSGESFQIYSAFLLVLIIFIFSIKSDMKKLINIIALGSLNLIFLFTPGTIFYLCLTYGDKFINNPFNEVIYTSYIKYVLNYPTRPAISTWIGPTFFINLVFILISLLFYLIDNKEKSNDNI